MAFILVQSGTTLSFVNTNGDVSTLSMPSGISLEAGRPRFALYNKTVIMVNTPTRPIVIDRFGNTRPLTPLPPATPPLVTLPGAGVLTGDYRVAMTYVIRDEVGNILAESGYSPISAVASPSSQELEYSAINATDEPVDGSRIYRTTAGGAVFYPRTIVDGLVFDNIVDNLPDASLSLFGAEVRGAPPRLTHVAVFRDRIFGVGVREIDIVRFSETGIPYAWNAQSTIKIDPAGSDAVGVTALIPRRDALGVARQNSFWQIVGTGVPLPDGTIDFNAVRLSESLGCASQETVDVFRDIAYFLGLDGVYRWGSDGIICISDSPDETGKVRAWFTTDDFFNRSMFSQAFGRIDPVRLKYRLYLASAGSSTIDRWVEYDLTTGEWWGPHKTDLFNPTAVLSALDAEGRPVIPPTVGGDDGNLYQDTATRTDGTSTPIALDVLSKPYDMDLPDYDKYFGELSIVSSGEASGQLVVQAVVGEFNSTYSQMNGRTVRLAHDLKRSRQRLGRLGVGKHAQLQLTNAEAGVNTRVQELTIDPVNLIGRR